jgi:hypothetical protein
MHAAFPGFDEAKRELQSADLCMLPSCRVVLTLVRAVVASCSLAPIFALLSLVKRFNTMNQESETWQLAGEQFEAQGNVGRALKLNVGAGAEAWPRRAPRKCRCIRRHNWRRNRKENEMRIKAILGLLVMASVGLALQAQTGWQQKVNDELPLMGHRNWIVIVDSAYPLQSSPGAETMETSSDQLAVLDYVLGAIFQEVRSSVRCGGPLRTTLSALSQMVERMLWVRRNVRSAAPSAK